MSDIAKRVGQRIRNYRNQLGISQEKLAELADVHPTYIGQLERGEKNATLETISKISGALNINLSTLFEKLEDANPQNNIQKNRSIPLEAYEIFSSKSLSEQEMLLKVFEVIQNYKENK